MTFIKRTRTISTRVSQDEYEALQRVSRQIGANSVSDYIRRMVMNLTVALPHSHAASDAVTADLAELQRKVDWLVRIVAGSEPATIAEPLNREQSRLNLRRVNGSKQPVALDQGKSLDR